MKEIIDTSGILGTGGVSVLFWRKMELKGCVELDCGLPDLLDDHQNLGIFFFIEI